MLRALQVTQGEEADLSVPYPRGGDISVPQQLYLAHVPALSSLTPLPVPVA